MRHGRRSRPLPTLARDLGDGPRGGDGCLDEHLQAHDDEHLDLHDVVGGARDQARRREPPDLLHREGLDLAEQLRAHGSAEARRDPRRADRRRDRREEAAERAGEHLAARGEDLGHGRALDLHQARDLGHVLGRLEVEPDLADDERER